MAPNSLSRSVALVFQLVTHRHPWLDVLIRPRSRQRYTRMLPPSTAPQDWAQGSGITTSSSESLQSWNSLPIDILIDEPIRSSIRWWWIQNDPRLSRWLDILFGHVHCMLRGAICSPSFKDTPSLFEKPYCLSPQNEPVEGQTDRRWSVIGKSDGYYSTLSSCFRQDAEALVLLT